MLGRGLTDHLWTFTVVRSFLGTNLKSGHVIKAIALRFFMFLCRGRKVIVRLPFLIFSGRNYSFYFLCVSFFSLPSGNEITIPSTSG